MTAAAASGFTFVSHRIDKRQDNKLKHCCIMLVIYLNEV
jgi:hypothetical protein